MPASSVSFGSWTDATSDLMYRGAMSYLLDGIPVGRTVLDLGGGSGLSRLFLPGPPSVVTTVDSDPDTRPDVLADILTYSPPVDAETVLLRYVLHYLTEEQLAALFDQIARWHYGPVVVVQFANPSTDDKRANSADSDDRTFRTPGYLLYLLANLPGWILGTRVNRLDFTVSPDFYLNRLGRAGEFPHRETLLGCWLERRA